MRARRWALFLALALLATPLAGARAQPAAEGPTRADQERLPMLRPAERELLLPLLDAGPVYLARFRQQADEMPAISVLLRVDASPDVVAALVAAPADYPDFMPALDEVTITRPARAAGEGPRQLAYRWRWQIGIFDLAGDNEMTVYPGNPTRGHRIDLRATGGDLGHGRFQWRIRPDPADARRSIVELGARVDTRDANYLADQLARGGTSVQRTIAISLATMMTLSVKRRAEGRSRGPRGNVATPLAPVPDPTRLRPMLAGGDLVHLQLEGDRLDRVMIYARMATPIAPVRRLMRDPNEFGQAMMRGSRARVLESGDEGILFEWEIPIPIVGVDGRMRLRELGDDGVSIDGVSGAMSAGQWRFRSVAAPHGEAEVWGWARFDAADTSPLLRNVVAGDSDFGHGIVVAGQVMLVRSLRSRAQAALRAEVEARRAQLAAERAERASAVASGD